MGSGKLVYAVKSVEDKEINELYDDWGVCKTIVVGKKAVYKSFPDEKREEAVNFLKAAPVKTEEFGKGYIPKDISRHIMFGKYLFDRCRPKENGFAVRVYETAQHEKFTVVGFGLPDNKGLVYAFTGEFVKNRQFGYEFQCESFTEHITDDKDSIRAFLTSGIVKGIGSKRAEQILELFGSRTMDVLENQPGQLLKIKGISKKALNKITESYNQNKMSREVVTYLLKHGISQKYGMEIFERYGMNAVTKIKENPYILCSINGISFLDADKIAQAEQSCLHSAERYENCAIHVLKANEITGNTGMEINAFGNEMLQLLNMGCNDITGADINRETIEIVKKGTVRQRNLNVTINGKVQKKKFLFLGSMINLEMNAAKNLYRIYSQKKNNVTMDEIKACINEIVKELHVTLDAIQYQAIIKAIQNNVLILHGGPGTGKTMWTNILARVYEKLFPEKKIALIAPTGRAARKLAESTEREASTFHSFFKIYDTGSPFEEEVLLKNTLVVADELSMVDIYVAATLFKAVGEGCTLVLIGDNKQLPSVGPGAVLRDLMESDCIPVAELKKIYRQNEDSMIYENSQKMREYNADIKVGKDFHFHEVSSMETVKNMMASKYVENVKKYGLSEVMCLCPYRDYTAGVRDMNITLQDMLNPKSIDTPVAKCDGYEIRKGDLVMHLCNDEMASNGDIGIVQKIVAASYDEENDIQTDAKIIVLINKKLVEYEKEEKKKLTLAYATTVHKSQGSQAKAVVFCLTSFHKGMLYMNIPMVAVSRGKENVDIYGEEAVLKTAIQNRSKNERVTLLATDLRLQFGKFVAV